MKKKFSKQYKQMMKKHRGIILKDAKDASTNPFSWGTGLQMFVDHLYFMRDYYALGENVWGLDEGEKPSRWQCLNMILAEYEEWQNCEDKYTKIVFKGEKDSKEKIEKLLKQGYYMKEDYDESYPSIFQHCYFFYLHKDWHENNAKFSKEYETHRKRFFELVGEYLECLWD